MPRFLRPLLLAVVLVHLGLFLAGCALGAEETKTAPEPLTIKMLKPLIAAPFQVKGETVTIAYAFQSPKELADWTSAGGDVKLNGTGVSLESAASLTHKVKFHEVEMHGDIAMGNRAGKHLGLTSGLTIECTSYNAWFVKLMSGSTKLAEDIFDKDYASPAQPNQYLSFNLSLSKGSARLTWDKVKLGKAVAGEAESVVLLGGDGGNKIRNVTISGTIDRAWLKDALEKLPAPAPKK